MNRIVRVRACLHRAAVLSGRPQIIAAVNRSTCLAISSRNCILAWKSRPANKPCEACRACSISSGELDKRINEVNGLFVEARELIADALDSAGTKYFTEDLEDAQKATKECLDSFGGLLQSLDDKRRGELTRSMGMKMEQLKGELNQILESLTKDEELPSRSR